MLCFVELVRSSKRPSRLLRAQRGVVSVVFSFLLLAAHGTSPQSVEMAEGMGLQAATATLSKVAIGAGLLTVPFAFREAGVGGAISILVGCVVLQACSLYALTLAIRRGGGDARAAAENRGYAGLVTALMGTDVGAYVDVVQSLCNFGAFVSFLQICATELGDFMMELSPVFRRAGFEECRIGGIWVMTLLVVFPLASMPTMSSLRFSSAFGLICISFVLFVVVVSFFVVDIDDGRGRICGNLNLNDNNEHMVPNAPVASNELPLMWTDSFISITKAATIIAFGFINQVQYVPILLELRNPSWARTWVLILGSTSVCFFADILIGSFGYLTFCSNTKYVYLLLVLFDILFMSLVRSSRGVLVKRRARFADGFHRTLCMECVLPPL